MRRLTAALCFACTIGFVWGAGPAAADPVKNPNAPAVLEVTCSGVPTFHVVGTGAAGHVLENNSIAVLLAGTTTTFVNGVQVEQITFDNPGRGVSTLACEAVAEFTAGADQIRIEITDARVHLTPARG
jgi:archaellum component FlaG (FlaF/FlaG flagellin family)